MTDKVTLQNVASIDNSLIAAINNNNATITTAFDNTLSRNGQSPNQMTSSLDMNSNPIINIPYASTPNQPVALGQLANVPSNNVNLTGDVTGTWNPTSGLLPTTLATVNSVPGTYGNSTNVPVVTVNSKGLATAVTTTPVAVSSVFGRTGSVVATTNDYSFSQINGTATPSQLPLFSSGSNGIVPASGGGTTNFLRADGSWVPGGGGGGGSNGLTQYNLYTTSQTITIPGSTTRAYIRLAGAMGGIGWNTSTNAIVTPQGGASLTKFLTSLTAGNTLILTIGSGTNSTTTHVLGTNASSTTLASGSQTISTLTCPGGLAGITSSTVPTAATGGDNNSLSFNFSAFYSGFGTFTTNNSYAVTINGFGESTMGVWNSAGASWTISGVGAYCEIFWYS